MAPTAEIDSVDALDDAVDNAPSSPNLAAISKTNEETLSTSKSENSMCSANPDAEVTDGSAINENVPEEANSAQSADPVDESSNFGKESETASVSNITSIADDENSLNSDDMSENQQFSEIDALGLPKEMLDEERRLALKTEKEFNAFSQRMANMDEEEKQRRYKTLMALLGKSSQYARYMSEKLLRDKEKVDSATKGETPNVLQNSTNKRKSSSTRGRPAKKPKTAAASPDEFDPETQYKNRSGLIVSKRQPKLLIGGVMRKYQLEGLEWLVALYKNAVNGILADEMGLGKTIQVISLICHLREKNLFGPHLIIAPLSTLPNWIFEFANFAPDVPVVLFHGPLEKRNVIKKQFIDSMKSKDRQQVPVVITSYEMPLFDRNFLSLVNWCHTIVDEGHRLKNYNSMLSIELRKYKTESRLLLTGTPLQNNITELWSLLNYLIPEIFDDLPTFENLFDFSDIYDSNRHDQLIAKEKEEQIISKMHQILEPFLLRRLKSDVNINIPRKKEILVYAPLSAEQETLYKAVLDRSVLAMAKRAESEPLATAADNGVRKKRRCALRQISYDEEWDIDEDTTYETIPRDLPTGVSHRRVCEDGVEYLYTVKLTVPAMMLRKIVNHPYLVKAPVQPGTRDIIIDDKMITHCGKLLVLDALLPRLKADDHKVLLFSTFTMMLDLIEDYVTIRGYKYVRIDGRRKIEERLEAIKQFNSDPETFIFLISTRAGGLGINLTAADTVILYNSDWNPQVDLQAQDRCHRIGQTRPVVVYRLVSAGTIDERIVNCATSKRRLEKLVVKKGKFKQEQNKEEISIDELHELLHSTDYKQVIHPNGLVLSDQQIEQILDRSDLLNEVDDESVANRKSSKSRNTRSSRSKSENVS